jgi:hypothetical protein
MNKGDVGEKKDKERIVHRYFMGNDDRCSSCESSHVEVYIKGGKVFLVCLDCGLKELLD